MEKIKPTRQLMPGESLPASNYASKDDVSAAATMASCAKQTADTANDRVTALDSSLQNNVTTSHLAVDIADVTTANITTGNLTTLNVNCGNLDNLTVACAASLNCVHSNFGSIDNLTTCNITMQNINADCGNFCCCVETDCVNARFISACCTTAFCSCAQNASICCAVIRCGNVQNLSVANTINSMCSCADCGRFMCELYAKCGIIACAYTGELTNVISKHDLWPQDVNGTDNYVEINADNGRVMILEENKDWGVIVDNSDTNNIINISNEKNYIDKVYVDHALKPNKVYLHFTTTPSHVYYKADTISGDVPVWYSALPIDPSLATTKAYDILEQNVVLYDKQLRINSLDISCLDLELNDLCVCGNLSSDGDICGQIIKANCCFLGNLCGSSECLGGYTFDEVICCAAGDIQSICELIPAAASCSNQLADKNWVNSSISTNTANFMGTYTDVACLPTVGVTNNDYAFVTCCDSCTGTITYDRYKWTSSDCEWHCEYSLNTSGFTADQLEAINSGITCTLVGKITDVRNSKITICQGTSCKGSFTLNQNSNCVISLDKGGLCKKQYDCAVSAERPLLMTPNTTTGDITDVYISCDNTLSFNPSTGVLTTCCFCGNLSGNATFATCTNRIRPADDVNTCHCKIELVGISCGANCDCWECIIVPRCCSRLVYDNCTGTLCANAFCGDITGNVTGNVTGKADDSTCFNGCTYSQACSDIRTGLTSCTGTVEFCDRGCLVNNDLPVTFKTTCSNPSVGASTCCCFTFNPSTGLLKTCCLCAATQVNTNTVCATDGCFTNVTATNISGTTDCAESINVCGKASDTKYLLTGVASAGTGKSLSVSCVACADDKPWVNFGSCQIGANYVCGCCRIDAPLFCGNVSGIAATVSNESNCWMTIPWANVGTVSSGKRCGCLYVQKECDSCPRLQYNPSTGVLCASCIQAGCFIGSIECAKCVCISSIGTNTDISMVGATSGYHTLCTSSCMPTVNACTGSITLCPSRCVTCGNVTARRYEINGLCYIQACWGSVVECDLQKALRCTLPGTWWCNNKCYAPVTGWIRASDGNVCVYTLLHVDCDSKYSFRDYQGCWIQVCGTRTTPWNDPGAIVLGPIWW